MKTSAALVLLFSCISFVNAFEFFEKRQATNTSSSSASLPTASQAPTVNSSRYDLTQHYCRLYRHASVYVNSSIYIDSGDTYTPQENTSFSDTGSAYDKGMNVNLLVLDLSKNFTANDTFPYRTIHKPPGVPPALEDSALWYSTETRKIYQLGGWFSRNGNPSTAGYLPESAIPRAAIWEFDVDAELWSQETDFINNGTGKKIDRPGAAAHCDAPTLNQNFIFEGFVQQFSDPDYANYTLYDTFKYIEGMLRLDTSQPEAPVLTNISIPTFLQPRSDGAMIHVPVGPKGILVLIGGQTTLNPNTPWGVPIAGASGGNVMINMTEVDLYDIESGYWFRQQTFATAGGGIPAGRGALCLALIGAADNSSWNIIMVAGISSFNPKEATSRQEIWALSLPTFEWVRLYGQTGAIYRHTCHLVGENLLIIGGMDRTIPAGDQDSTSCQSSMPARIFSMPNLNYTGQFDYAASQRTALVPSAVVSVIGGTPSGGASKTAPLLWSDLYLQYVFNPTIQRPTYTPPATYILAAGNDTNSTNTTSTPTSTPTSTNSPSASPSPSKKSSHTGAIAGGVVGGIAGLALLGALIFFLCFRRKPDEKTDDARHAELPSYQEAKEVGNGHHNNLHDIPRTSPIEMPTPGSPTPVGWHDERVGGEEAGDNVTPLVGHNGQDGNEWGTPPMAAGATRHKRGGSDSRFSEVSDESGNTAVGSGYGGSPSTSPRIPRREVGAVSKQSMRSDVTG
ncbi:uncharacterized protein PAC_18685 [Phialocephala subalpina]|uniref:Uncharacterized protein n=1 Tax=Phialocephala subalpina TaxID=576137 RepID=A0A1L7XUU2_9HELO|nr:uncharacterized protein PAC_18685 [Phialocephala subalpina]